MRVIIAGDRDCDDFNFLLEAITQAKKQGIEITEVVSGAAKGGDELGEQWARMHDIPIRQFKPNWNDITVPGAKIKTNQWGKQYNALAGFVRNQEMADYGEALIALQPNGNTNGTQDMIKRAKEKGIKIYVHTNHEEVNNAEEIPF